MIFVGPLGDRAVRFETTMNDYRSTVESLRDDLGLGERFVGISAGLCRSFLKGGMAAARRLVIRSAADSCENTLGGALALHVVYKVIVDLKGNAVLLKILNQLRVGHLVADGIVNVVFAHRARGFASAGRGLG